MAAGSDLFGRESTVSPEQKKHLLYAGGAIASIGGLILFMRSKSAPGNMPISGAGMGAGSAGGGGVSSGTSANNAAALNAAVALGVEQSRQANALSVAQLQSQTALQIAGLQANSVKDQANAKTAQAALGPGGAVTAAAPALAKGLFDTVQDVINNFFKTAAANSPFVPQGNILDTDNPNAKLVANGANDFGGYSLYPESTKEGYYIYENPPATDTYNMPDFTQYVEPASYGDYYQGSIGSGDSGYTGSTPTDFGAGPDAYNPGENPGQSEGVV